MPALFIGFLAGIFCFYMVTTVKNHFGYDDSLDAFGVHGAGGTLGALLTGIFATSAVNDALKDSAGKALPLGLVDGNGAQILNQVIGIAIAIFLGMVGTFVILKIVDLTMGVRATAEQEMEGLDLSMHGEEGYNLDA
jgi:Amt family ammonium transporter